MSRRIIKQIQRDHIAELLAKVLKFFAILLLLIALYSCATPRLAQHRTISYNNGDTCVVAKNTKANWKPIIVPAVVIYVLLFQTL